MRKWLKSLLSSEGDASSKRVSAILSLLVCISFAYIATFTEYKCPDYMFEGLLVIAGGGLGLTVIESIFTRYKKKGDTPSEEQ
jgi:hypothetical protein